MPGLRNYPQKSWFLGLLVDSLGLVWPNVAVLFPVDKEHRPPVDYESAMKRDSDDLKAGLWETLGVARDLAKKAGEV